MKIRIRHIALIFTLLVFGGIANDARAAKVTYHILTLPINSTTANMMSAVDGHRLEAVKVVVDKQTTVELPAHYKSPLAKDFKYYKPEDIEIGSSAVQIYENNSATKGILYRVKGENTATTDDDPTPVAEGTVISGNTDEYYVVYTYNDANTIAKLDGSVSYNIGIKGKGFLSLNRGRNNRPAVVPKGKVDPEMLASEDFMKVESPGGGITTYWQHADNKNKKEDVESQFHFMFQFEGMDPYNIIIRNTYNRNLTYIEKNDDGDKKFVYKWYKGGQLFSVGNANSYIASDIHRRYQQEYNSANPNPTELTAGTDYVDRDGHFHGQSGTIWGSYALLNNTKNDGYVFMGTRTVNGNGDVPTPGNDNKYNYLKFDNNNLTINKLTETEATNSYSTEGIYPIEKVTFKVSTPFYASDKSVSHIVSVEDWVSKYTVDNDPIETKYLPASLRRKYCSYTGKFYKNPECTEEITHFSQAEQDNTEGYKVYIGYTVSASIPFKAITPKSSYTDAELDAATWYELTDAASSQIDGMKLKFDGSKFNNDGADGDYSKTSEFAFIGDPYELQVIYRDATTATTPHTLNYVGAIGTPSNGEDFSISTTATAGYVWQMPNDATAGSFLLQKYKGEGNWYWEVARPAPVDIDYTMKTHTYNVATANAQAVTFNVTNLTDTDGYYITVTAGGNYPGQVTVPGGKIYVEPGGTASFTAAIKSRGDSGDKQFTLSVQEYNSSDVAQYERSVITVNQNTTAVSSHTVEYNTDNSTRIKVMELPKQTYTYKIVDKSGRIAVTASASQTIFSPLSLASIPSIIISPFIVDETVTFYSTFDNGGGAGIGTSRKHLSDEIKETPSASAPIYVKYTTEKIISKPFNLSEDQEIFVRLNGQYLYFDAGARTIKSSVNSSETDKNYKWKLRNRDPYAMLIDNMGAREVLPDVANKVAGQSENPDVFDDEGTMTNPERQMGAWVKLAAAVGNDVALAFDTDRTNAQRFIAKRSAQTGVYEVMVATGDGVDANTTYYHIGRPAADNTVKIYNNETYQAGDDEEIKFLLEESASYVYHLIDKAKHELLTVESRSPELVLPAEYQSPLVGAENYSYYAPDNINITSVGNTNTYSPIPSATKLSSLSGLNAIFEAPTTCTESDYTSNNSLLTANDLTDLENQARKLTTTGSHYFKVGDTYYLVYVTKPFYNHIYVTYEGNDLIGFNNTGRVNDHPYLLRFLDPFADGYYLEDGKDGLMTEKLKAIYPYCNGDGNLNIYGEKMRNEQMDGGSSTRPRWVWYFESANSDPYHVRIHSRSTISFNSVNNPTYLETKAVHFNQDADANTKHIITGGSLPGIASTAPTEYMVLGLPGAYKLVTTDKIDDGSTNEHRTVVSFEQYWKTYNMVKLHVLGLSASTDGFSDDESTWEVPTADDPETAGVDESSFRATLAAKDWHSYDAYANATRWNGYNDKSSGHDKKVVEKLEHWFQTFDMGNGTFDIEDADIPPVLVLLDRHGWEIMRKPLPAAHYPEGDDELAALRAYDSPLVDRYYFYSNATKASGCHKYTLRLNDNNEERDQIKVNGVHYSSTSLGDLPPASASGVKSSGVLNDQFVIYTVKEEYEQSYKYEFNDNTESVTASKFLMLQNARFARDNDGTGDRISYLSKPIHEASNPTGGNVYDMIMSPSTTTVSNVSTNVDEYPADGKIDDKNLWFLQPNLNIDKEMGIKWAVAAGGGSEPMTEYETKMAYKDKTGFDPYNIQLKNAGNGKFLTAHMTSTKLENGIMVGDYSGEGGSYGITFEDWVDVKNADTQAQKTINGEVVDEGYDHTNLKVTNQTFMAVSDANGNMQLMPRFDHTKRINVTLGSSSLTTLQDPVDNAVASVDANSSMGPQTTFFIRPQKFIYHILDNNGREALRYTRSGDYYPDITEHFKSPLATDFTYYSGYAEAGAPAVSTAEAWTDATEEFKRTATSEDMLTDLVKLLPTAGTYQYRIDTRGDFTYKSVVVTEGKGLLEQQITGALATAGYTADECHVYVRYNYNEDADRDADRILLGQWFTVKLGNKDLQADGTIVTKDDATTDVEEVPGTGVSLYTGTKPGTINENKKEWQWKFLQAPTDPSSDYYEVPDPYAVRIFNRHSNYTTNPTVEPSPMAEGIKVPHATDGTDTDRFALLSHPSGGYALIVAKTYSDFNYPFLNGGSMTAPDASPTAIAATTATEASFNYKNGIISDDAQILVDDDVVFNYKYNVITNEKIVSGVNVGNKLAVTAEQDNTAALSHDFYPYLPESAQTPLLNMEDYVYYGFASQSGDPYSVIPQTKLYTLYGLYDDIVYVRYGDYSMDKTNFKVPNKKDVVDSKVARHSDSHDVSMNINGELPYNIIWENDNMMRSVDDTNTISDGGSQSLSGNKNYVWYFEGNDPYALKIKHNKTGSYVDGSTALVDEANAQEFMLLKKDGYDYGILQVTGTTGSNAGKKLTGYGGELTANASTDPTKFIIFGLSVHDLIYRLVIAETCSDTTVTTPPIGQYVDIPFRTGTEASPSNILTYKRIYGTTQRDLKSENTGEGTHLAGEKYQLGSTLSWGNENHTYSHKAGSVSIGDDLWVPNIFYRPNCTFEFYIEGIYNTEGTTEVTELNDKFKGLKLRKLMSDSELIDKTVVVNIVYSFDKDLTTNSGLDFVRSKNDNFWYTFETMSGTTPYLAHYTNAWGLQAMEGRETRYTNDYLWTPLGDVYGFKMYNRYMLKNSDGENKVMTMTSIGDNVKIKMAVPGEDGFTSGNEVFELIAGDRDGYFRVHPVINNTETKYYVRRKDTAGDIDADGNDDMNYTILSTTPSDWTFYLDMALMEPYHERAGYLGGLTPEGKTKYEEALNKDQFQIIELQKVVYDDNNIIHFTPGYYRLHSQPGVSGISPVRYASGYLHDIEKTAGESSSAIPMHFYSKRGVSTTFAGEDGLGSGFTVTDATHGEIPVLATENDPSTIFYFPGNGTNNHPQSAISTQGLYVKGVVTDSNNGDAVMTSNSGEATPFSIMDIGGAIFLIHDGSEPTSRIYLNYDQNALKNKYDLKYYHNAPTDEARWCIQPVQKTATAGNGEMPLTISTNNGGDGYYYTTFYAPFDVLLPTDVEADPSNSITAKTYNAYICKKWHNEGVNPSPVPASGSYAEGKFVPAGTPVIIRVKDESGSVTLTLPSTSPPSSSSLTSVLKGSYLEKLLAVDASNDVYVLGLPMISEEVDKASDYVTSGDITAPLPEFDNDKVGFYINATPNKEHNPLKSLWTRNNRYVLHNKVYYRGGNADADAPAPRRDVPIFVPVIFDDEEELDPTEENRGSQNDESRSRYDNRIYDLQGRCVATEEEVADGSWRYRLPAGIYIHRGKKIMIGK